MVLGPDARRCTRQQQLGGGRAPDGRWRRNRRERHAPGAVGPQHLVPRVDGVDRHARASPDRRHAAGCADAHRRQQRRCGVVLHEHDGRLERSRCRRGRSRRRHPLPHTGGDAVDAGVDGHHPREGQRRSAARGARDDLGPDRRQGRGREPARARVGAAAGWRLELHARRSRDRRDTRAAVRRRRAGWHSRAEPDRRAA